MKKIIKSVARKVIPKAGRQWLRRAAAGDQYVPPPSAVRFGDFRRVTPFNREYGYDRGQPIDRYYIENFLERCSGDVRGRVLEVGDNSYTEKFGGRQVEVSDVLHVVEGTPGATIISDVSRGENIPSEAFDCIVFTQTLHIIYDVRAAVGTLHRSLKPGGVLLATFPGLSQIESYDWKSSWYWGLTTLSARRLFGEFFAERDCEITAHGNVLTTAAFLYGLAAQELTEDELDRSHDPLYEMLITVRAVKAP